MHFTIITPSFNQLEHLKRCVASVADQVALTANRSISIHHHVQDACSTDGTVEWLKMYESKIRMLGIEKLAVGAAKDDETPHAEGLLSKAHSFSYKSKSDEGMYDAVNKGVAFVGVRHEEEGIRGEIKTPNPKLHALNRDDGIIAWLNCDEQYLPGTLEKVATFFKSHPDVDLVFGGMLMVDATGELLACRKAMPMRRLFLEASYLYNFSCAMFFRESLWRKLGGFNTSFKNAGDEDLIRRALELKAKCGVLNDYLATFTYSDTNLSSDPSAVEEHEALKRVGSVVGRVFRLPINILRLGEKFIRGGHVQRMPVEYEVYVDNSGQRKIFRCEKADCRWPDEKRPYLFKHRLGGS